MRILLISTNRLRPPPPFPLGLAYIVANLERDAHEVKVLDLMFLDDFKGELEQAIRDFDPDLISLSIRNIDDENYRTPRFFLSESKEIVQICQMASSAKILLGGPGFSIFPESSLLYLNADMGIVGEGEKAFSELVGKMDRGEDYTSLPGLVTIRDNRIILNQPQLIESFDDLKMPERTLLDAKRYWEETGMILPQASGIFPEAWTFPEAPTIQDKRGCCMECIYCSQPLIEGKKIRIRSPQKVVDELEVIRKDVGKDKIQFVDSLFNYPIEHAESICQEIIRRRLDIQWSCGLNPAFVTRRLIGLMRKAGCTHVDVGNESGSDKMLKNLRKGFSVEDVKRCCLYLKEYDLSFACYLLLGGPGENKETVEESISLMEKLAPNIVNVAIGIRIYPGCEMAQIAQKEGYISPSTDLLTPTFYLSSQVKDWIFDYWTEVYQRNQNWILF
jgi:radical SAM superfamily enzyme YgiQ (UPF0313 family)